MDYYVLDTETTGFSPKTDSIIEIAVIKVHGDEITERFETFVNPGRPIPEFISNLTGICDTDVADAPDIETAAAELARFLSDPLPIVGHNIAFDLRFIRAALARIGVNANFRCIDTLDLARKAFPNMLNYKLDTLIDCLDLSDCKQTHRAMDDVMVTRNLLIECRKCLTSESNKGFKMFHSPVFGERANIPTPRNGERLSPEEDSAVSAIIAAVGELAPLVHLERRSQNYLTLVIPERGRDFCRVKASPHTLWMSLDTCLGGILFPDDPRLAEVRNQNQRHWKIPLSSVDKISLYADLIFSCAQSALAMEEVEHESKSGEGEAMNEIYIYQHKEMKFLESIRPALKNAISEQGGPEQFLSFSLRKEYSVVSFLNFTVFRLHLRKTQQYFSIPTLFEDVIPESFPKKRLQSQPDFIRLLIDDEHPAESYAAFLSQIAGETVNRYPKEWDCCSRYMECSDAGKCVHPDKAFALECGYRKILASGRIFYGERRNVD